MDAITMLRNDHREVEKLFKKFEKLDESADAQRRTLARQISTELTRHAMAEEQAFYPAVREALPDLDSTVLEGLEEHHIVKVTLSELAGMDPQDERFLPKVTVMIEAVRHHVEEEEGELFPLVRQGVGRKALQELAIAMEQAKKAAPSTPPSPQAPDTPPGNLTSATRDVAARARRAMTGAGRTPPAKTGTSGGSRSSSGAGRSRSTSPRSRAKTS